jgi:hypothetical protein
VTLKRTASAGQESVRAALASLGPPGALEPSPCDPDFDLMFSGKVKPVVGSYRYSVDEGRLASTDFIPKSYFA